MEVSTAMSVLRARAGRGGRSSLKRFTNSAARGEASVALPPLPKRMSFPPRSNTLARALETCSTSCRCSFRNCSLRAALSLKAWAMRSVILLTAWPPGSGA